MYYKLDQNVPIIHNQDINYISGKGLSYVTGQYSCSYLPFLRNTYDEILGWKDSIGYYLNDTISIFDPYNYSSNLTFYPDNEEMLLFYNPSGVNVEIEFLNTISLLKQENFDTINKYDDYWVKVSSPYSLNPFYQKDITNAINYQPNENYKQPRFNTDFKHKLVPRHPFNTKDNMNKDNVYGLFLPEQFETALEEYQVDKVEKSDVLIATILGGLRDQYNNKISLGKNQILILDQLTTQFRINKGDVSQLKIHPLWYKTNVRKNFHYSI